MLAQTANLAATPSAAPSVNPQASTAPNVPGGGIGMGPMLGLVAALQGIINAWDADLTAAEQKIDTLLTNINEMENSGDTVQWLLAQSLRVELLGETLHRSGPEPSGQFGTAWIERTGQLTERRNGLPWGHYNV